MLDVNDNGDFSSFAMLDTVVDKYKVFFTGETHWSEGNFELKWKMLQYLYHKAGVRVLVVEGPASLSYLLNHYTAINDSDSYFSLLDYVPGGAKERIFYRHLFRFNRSKPAEERITIRGIDREYNVYLAITSIKKLLDKKTVPELLRDHVELLVTTRERQWADSILQKLEADPAHRSYYGSDYNWMITILSGIACKTCDPPHQNMKSTKWLDREDLMYRNFLRLLDEFPNAKYFGQFGKAHVCLQPPPAKWFVANWNPIAARLHQWDTSPVKGQVLSIAMEYYFIKGVDKHARRAFRDQSEDDFNLFRLDKEGTPFDSLGRFFPYLLNIDFLERSEMEYNKKNDHYGYMAKEYFIVKGLSLGYQRWHEQAVEIGRSVTRRNMLKRNHYRGRGAYFEFNPDKRLHTIRLSRWWGNDPFFIGFSPVYSTNYRHSAFFIRPEAGLKKNIFSLTYSYNAALYNKRLTGMNEHMVSLRMLVPWSKD